MSERRIAMPEFSGNGLRAVALGAAALLSSTFLTGCEVVEEGTATFTCYTVGAEGGGINGPGISTASGTKPIPGEVAAGNLAGYYKDRAIDYNGNGVISVDERNRSIRENPLRVHVPGMGTFRLEDTGGNFKVNNRFDLALWAKDCRKFGKRVLPYVITG